MDNDYEIDSCGWIDPDGKFIPCKSYEHSMIAWEILQEKGLQARYNQTCDDAIEELLGYIKVYRDFATHKLNVGFVSPATSEQVNTIKRIKGNAYQYYVDDLECMVFN